MDLRHNTELCGIYKLWILFICDFHCCVCYKMAENQEDYAGLTDFSLDDDNDNGSPDFDNADLTVSYKLFVNTFGSLPLLLSTYMEHIAHLNTELDTFLREAHKKHATSTIDKQSDEAMRQFHAFMTELDYFHSRKLNIAYEMQSVIRKYSEDYEYAVKKEQQEQQLRLSEASEKIITSSTLPCVAPAGRPRARGRPSGRGRPKGSRYSRKNNQSSGKYQPSKRGRQAKKGRGRGRGSCRGGKRSSIADSDVTEDTCVLTEETQDDTIYCFCMKASYFMLLDLDDKMVACDNDDCTYKWLHWTCVGLTYSPPGKWYCPECRGNSPSVPRHH
ncbi:Chromatin modification-related protein YNG2 [Trichinella britovi]|uniref:Chromatin modification-related protein YNG2 n=2 Tax=Trichinella TaxID=6333 RepID=A0A0V1D4N1_TRIBR|nr:Chromatin modification-related protein YNG2 [Trichinella murrelli]KRY56501.1 Chromatin modification-related protein YNG2 [Trichinella britovi]